MLQFRATLSARKVLVPHPSSVLRPERGDFDFPEYPPDHSLLVDARRSLRSIWFSIRYSPPSHFSRSPPPRSPRPLPIPNPSPSSTARSVLAPPTLSLPTRPARPSMLQP